MARSTTTTADFQASIPVQEWDEDAGKAVDEALEFSGFGVFTVTETGEDTNVFEVEVEWDEELQDGLLDQERREWCREQEEALKKLYPNCTVIWV